MANRPILDIEIADDKWQAFLHQFEKHKTDLDGMPGVWAKIGQKMDASGAAALATAESVQLMAANQEKFLRSVAASSYSMEGLARHTQSVWHSVHEMVGDFVKLSALTGLIGGILGVGSLWGIDRLALSAGGARRSALGLGVTSGEQQAFGINFGRFVDPNSTLENIANAQNDVSKWRVFSSLGIKDFQTRDAASLAPEFLAKAKALFDRNPTQQSADAYGLTDVISMDDLRRLHNTPQSELDQAGGRYAKDRTGLAVSGRDQQAWQDFTQQLSRAGTLLENTLIHGLVGLAKPLGDLSQGVSDVVKALAKSPEVKSLLDSAASGLEHFAKFIGTPEFKSDVEGFVDGLGRIAKALVAAVEWLASKVPAVAEALPPALGGGGDFKKWYGKNDPYYNETWLERAGVGGSPGRIMHDYFKSQGLDEATIAGFESSTQKESAFNPAAPGGGLFQLTGSRYDDFIKAVGVKPEQASIADQLAFAMYEYKNSPQGYEKAVNATPDTPEARYSAVRKYFERPAQQYLDRDEASGRADARTFISKYGQVDLNVHVTNTTGAQVSISSNQAAGQ